MRNWLRIVGWTVLGLTSVAGLLSLAYLVCFTSILRNADLEIIVGTVMMVIGIIWGFAEAKRAFEER